MLQMFLDDKTQLANLMFANDDQKIIQVHKFFQLQIMKFK